MYKDNLFMAQIVQVYIEKLITPNKTTDERIQGAPHKNEVSCCCLFRCISCTFVVVVMGSIE